VNKILYFVYKNELTIRYLADVLGKNARIIGGYDADIKNFPYMASIRITSTNEILCAGTIISQLHILSAAHCYFQRQHLYPYLRIYTGCGSSRSMTDGPNFIIADVFIHHDFTGEKSITSVNRHDISVVKVIC
jgi:secreted trypsin-like serine protease